MEKVLESGDIVIRKMEDVDRDYQLLFKWLTDNELLQFVYGPSVKFTLGGIKKKYRHRVLGIDKDGVMACFFSYKKVDVGYMQYYPAGKPEDYQLESVENVWGIDMWIGEKDYWGKGIGSKVLNLMSDYLIENRRAVKVVIDPHTDNQRAIRAYEKAGFKKVKILKKHEWHDGKKVDSWLMEKLKT